MTIADYHDDPYQAERLDRAMAEALNCAPGDMVRVTKAEGGTLFASVLRVHGRDWPHGIYAAAHERAQADLYAAMKADFHRLIARAIRDKRRKETKRKKAARARCGYRRKQ